MDIAVACCASTMTVVVVCVVVRSHGDASSRASRWVCAIYFGSTVHTMCVNFRSIERHRIASNRMIALCDAMRCAMCDVRCTVCDMRYEVCCGAAEAPDWLSRSTPPPTGMAFIYRHHHTVTVRSGFSPTATAKVAYIYIPRRTGMARLHFCSRSSGGSKKRMPRRRSVGRK